MDPIKSGFRALLKTLMLCFQSTFGINGVTVLEIFYSLWFKNDAQFAYFVTKTKTKNKTLK